MEARDGEYAPGPLNFKPTLHAAGGAPPYLPYAPANPCPEEEERRRFFPKTPSVLSYLHSLFTVSYRSYKLAPEKNAQELYSVDT
ncbi:hypothetical protein U9M48_036231 [Paspalum notatum var. saurae]|uniref:Uncharacterized protein n=1 Tax=Paspalum notatum var. saurae TaxID=547442 RepID=A0AAQ3UH32_PASNO